MKLSDREADRIIREGWQAYTDSFPREGIPEHPFSPAFERKMARLVRRQRRRENRPPVLRAAGRAAAWGRPGNCPPCADSRDAPPPRRRPAAQEADALTL